MKKSVKVASIIKKINVALANDKVAQEVKAGYCVVAEMILHEAGAYKGYIYNSVEEIGKEYKVVNGTEYSRHYSIAAKLEAK